MHKLQRLFKTHSKAIQIQIHCILLFAKNLIYLQKLNIYNVSLSDVLVLEGNQLDIYWRIKGCHKIRVQGLGVFQGNIHGFNFIFTKNINPIQITFYGVFKNAKRRLLVKSYSIHLKRTSIPKLNIPIATEVPLSKGNYRFNSSANIILVKNIEIERDHLQLKEGELDKYKNLVH